MKMITKAYLSLHKNEIIKEMKEGRIFVYPSDGLYCIGCNALNRVSVLKIRQLKRKDSEPYSVIAPSVEWINENCGTNKNGSAWVKKLPGAYTLVLPLKNPASIAPEVNMGGEKIGVRMPNHWFCELVKESGMPFVTTPANASGMPKMTDFYNLDSLTKEQVDYILYEGALRENLNTLVDITGEKEIITENLKL